MLCDLDNMNCGDNRTCLFDKKDDGKIDVGGEGVCVSNSEYAKCDETPDIDICTHKKNNDDAVAKVYNKIEPPPSLDCSKLEEGASCYKDGDNYQGKGYNNICIPNNADEDEYKDLLNQRKGFQRYNNNRFQNNEKMEEEAFKRTIETDNKSGGGKRKTRRLKKKAKKAKKTNRKIKKKKRRSIKRKRKRSKGSKRSKGRKKH